MDATVSKPVWPQYRRRPSELVYGSKASVKENCDPVTRVTHGVGGNPSR